MGLTLQWMAVGVCLVWVANVQTIINDSTAVLSPPDWGGGRSWGEREREATEDERGRVEDGKLVAEGLGYEKVKRDVKDLPAGCKTPPSVNHISQEWQRSEGGIIGSCDTGYESPFGGRKLVIMCVDGKWEQLPWPDPSNPSCVPLCSPACSAGRCVAPNTCECPYGLYGSLCEIATGCSEPPLIPRHTKFVMGRAGSGKLTCEEGYGFPSNETELSLVCINGLWFAPGVEHEENELVTRGRVKGDSIICMRKLGMESVQRSDADPGWKCPTPPHVPHASLVLIEDESSFTWTFEVRCLPGYFLPNTNLTKITIHLEGGVWKTPEEFDMDYKDVSCELPCVDEGMGMDGCQNGGSCVEGVCVCPTNSTGQFCEMPRCSHLDLPTLYHAYYFYADEVTPEGNPILKIQCQKGFFFPDNSTVASVKCSNGSWEFGTEGMYQRCLPRCRVVCMPPLVCVGQDQCGCDRNATHEGTCKLLVGIGDELPQIVDGHIVQKPDGTYYLKCKKGYQINDQQKLDMVFFNDTWLLMGVFPAYSYQCKPQCSPPCGNREECFKPNECRCLPYFEGKNCENIKPMVHPCPSLYPYIPYGNVSDDGKLVCIGGFQLSNNLTSTNLTCKNGQYEVEEGDGKCHPVCKPGCYNGGTCVAPGVCVCIEGFSGRRCQLTECPISMPELLFATIVQCTYDCPFLICQVGYKFPTGENRMPLNCVDGEWRTVYNTTVVSCEPKCDPACVNGGVCVAPQKCSCPAGYGGDQCQLPKRCSSLPTGLVNAKFWNKGDTGIAFCTDGYTFNSRSGAEENITCVKGNWEIIINGERRNELVKIKPQNIGEMVLFQLGCLPLCNPPCLNGGTCVSHNLCMCPPNEHGTGCHLHTCFCPLPHILNANYLYGGDVMAILRCKPGFRFSFGGDLITLTCRNTEWLVHDYPSFVPPSCLPVCVQECLNGGACQEDGTCACPPGYIGLSCEIQQDEQCFDSPPAIDNTMLTLTNHTGTYTCLPGFRLGNGTEVTVLLECRGSRWVFPEYNDTTPQCEFWCQEGECGLEGECLPSGKCVCSPYWTGERCIEPVLGAECSELQLNHTIIKPLGSNVTEVQVTCLNGYEMSNGMTTLKMTCVEGMWLSRQPTHHEDALGCHPVCDRPCLNGGICVIPNRCECAEFFEGKDCSKLVYGKCEAVINKPANLTLEKRNGSLVLRCESERPVGAGDVEFVLSCSFGNWITPMDWSWNITCATGGSCTNPHAPRNAYISGNSSGIYMVCDKGFNIEGEKIVGLECIPERDAWALVMTETFFLEDVECTLDTDEVCNLECGPNGVCAHNVCVCDSGWTGPLCRTQLCTSTDFLVDNAEGVSYIKPGEQVVVFCSAGHRLPSGTSSVTLTCDQGSWMLSGVMLGHQRTRCKPLCDPPCHNLGKCIGHNVCECQFGFTGSRCTICGDIPDLRVTTSGISCNFPYTVNGKEYNDCFQADRDSPAWCPTIINIISGQIIGSGMCLYDWGYKRITITYSGKTCKFPFLHEDTLRSSCVTHGNLSYCPTITDKNNRPVEYEQCASEDDVPNLITNADLANGLLVATTDGQICEFPFVYLGVTYKACIKTDSGAAWCATKVDVNREVLEYGVCIYTEAPSGIRPTNPIIIDIANYCRKDE
ncbi:neurogenic locus notch homolog protein 1-like isoform X1 [Scylla paramamosain]|uniref:neurogenic locus notch homolog protein 1-like isoform X1 n=2 Tax=Scylla paramamosain TaxID=85552 RepID=UPI003082BB1B